MVLAGHHQPLRVWVLCLYFMGLNLSNWRGSVRLLLREKRLDYSEERYRQRVLANLRRRAKSLGYVLQTTDPIPPVAAVS